MLLGRGRDDPYYGVEQFHADLEMLARRYVVVEPYEGTGAHAWTAAMGEELGAFVSRLLHPTPAATRLSRPLTPADPASVDPADPPLSPSCAARR